MKPLNKPNDVILSTAKNSTAFKMQTSGETFEIFSDQIYEHKIRAIIRELSCNAKDSHGDAGCPEKPFRIHFPTMFEPYFEIEDYGVGLNDYDIRGEEKVLYDADGNEVSRVHEGGLYTTYFASTKRENEEAIGYLGIGSKSPLCYTKSFSIIARKDGVEYNYDCLVNENGEPQTVFNGQYETDKVNGVKIRFAVSASDIEEFRKEAEFVLSLFKVKPETNVELNYMLSENELEELNTTGVLVLNSTHPFIVHEQALVYCNMGGVVYPVRTLDYDYMSDEIMINEDDYNTGVVDTPEYYKFDSRSTKLIKNMIQRVSSRIILKFENGSLKFLPSREGLSQNPITKFNFYKNLNESMTTMVDNLQGDIDKSACELEAVKRFSKFSEPYSIFAYDYKYNGQSITSIYNFDRLMTNLTDYFDDDRSFIFHQHDYKTGYYGFDDETCVRRLDPSTMVCSKMLDILNTQETVDCFYVNDPEDLKAVKGAKKAVHFYNKNLDVKNGAFFVYEDVDDQFYDDLDQIFYGNVNFRHISELFDEVIKIDPNFFTKKARNKGTTKRVKKKTQTKARLITIDLTKDYGSGITNDQKLVNLSVMNPNTTCYVRYNGYSYSNFKIDVNGNEYVISKHNIIKFMKYFGIHVCLVMNGVNRTKISNSDIKCIGKFIESLDRKIINNIKKSYIHNSMHYKLKNYNENYKSLDNFQDAMYTGSPYNSQKGNIKFLLANDDEMLRHVKSLKEDVDKFIKSHCMKEDEVDRYGMFSRFFDNSDVNIDEINNKETEFFDAYRELVDCVKDKFPLLFTDIDENKDAIVDYMNMVNRYNKENELKIA